MSKSKVMIPDFGPPTELASATETVGAWLARTRAGHGAEPRDMARHLGLNPTIILALEADDFARLGPPVFVRGYLSLYARLLNLPESAVLERYHQQSGASQEPPPLKVVHPGRRQARVRDLRGIFYLLVVIGIGWTAIRQLDTLDPSRLLAWWQRGDQTNAQPSASRPMAGATQIQHPFQSPPAEETREPGPPPGASKTPPATPPEPVSASSLALSTPPESVPAPVAPTVVSATVLPAPAVLEDIGDSSSPEARSGARLMLQFSEDCWVKVKDAQGKVLVNELMKADTSRAISGPAPFTVILGNAPAARIALDDRPVDTAVYLPRRGTVSRFTLNSQP